MKLKNRLRRIVNKISSRYYLRIREEWDMKNHIGLDSLELLLMMNYIEEEFEIQIDDNEFMEKNSFGDIVNYVDDQLNMAA